MKFKSDLEAFQVSHPFSVMEIQGCSFHYLLCGREESPCTLVYFVGGTGNPLGWYRHVLAMESKYRILLLDYPMGVDEMEQLTGLIGALIRELDIEKAVWIGASFGGYIAQLMAKKNPEITRAMVLYATTALSEKGIDALKKQYRYMGTLLWLMEHGPYGLLKGAFMKPMLKRLIPREHTDYAAYMKDFIQWIYEGYTRQTDLHMTRLMADIGNLTPVRSEDFDYLKGRVQLILPQNDKAFSPQMQEELMALLRYPDTETMEGGHLATLFRAEEFAARTDAFLKKIHR